MHHSGWKVNNFPEWRIFAGREYHLVDQAEERYGAGALGVTSVSQEILLDAEETRELSALRMD